MYYDVIFGCWWYVNVFINVIGSYGSFCCICYNVFIFKEIFGGWNEEVKLYVCICVCWDNWKVWSVKYFEWLWLVVNYVFMCVLVIVVGICIYRGENKICVDVVGCFIGI